MYDMGVKEKPVSDTLNLSVWMTRRAAARVLGLSPRQVERMGAIGVLHPHVPQHIPEERPVVLYSVEEVMELRRARERTRGERGGE